MVVSKDKGTPMDHDNYDFFLGHPQEAPLILRNHIKPLHNPINRAQFQAFPPLTTFQPWFICGVGL